MGELARAAEARLRPFLIEQTRDGLAILSTNIGGEARGGGRGWGVERWSARGSGEEANEEATPRRSKSPYLLEQRQKFGECDKDVSPQ